jgi:hypothetical protein
MLAKMEARLMADNEKFEVLRDTLISWMDAHQERMMDDGLSRKEGGHDFGGKFSGVRFRSCA